MSKSGNKNSHAVKLSYTENLYNQIKKYEDSIAVNPLMPSYFHETDESLPLAESVSLIKESFVGANSDNMLDIIIEKIKNIESMQKLKIKNTTGKKGEISGHKTAMADLIHKSTESLDIEEIKAAVRANKFF